MKEGEREGGLCKKQANREKQESSMGGIVKEKETDRK